MTRCVRSPRGPVREAIAALGGWDGAVLGEPSTDTLKRVDASGLILGTEPRSGIFRAQTPQVARLGLWREPSPGPGRRLPGHRRRLPAGGHGPAGQAHPRPRQQPEAHHPGRLGPLQVGPPPAGPVPLLDAGVPPAQRVEQGQAQRPGQVDRQRRKPRSAGKGRSMCRMTRQGRPARAWNSTPMPCATGHWHR